MRVFFVNLLGIVLFAVCGHASVKSADCLSVTDPIDQEACYKKVQRDIQAEWGTKLTGFKKKANNKSEKALEAQIRAELKKIDSFSDNLKKERDLYAAYLKEIDTISEKHEKKEKEKEREKKKKKKAELKKLWVSDYGE